MIFNNPAQLQVAGLACLVLAIVIYILAVNWFARRFGRRATILLSGVGAALYFALLVAFSVQAGAHEMAPNLYRLVQFTPPSGGVTGPPSSTVNNCVAWNSTSGKVLKDTGFPCGSGSGSLTAVSVATANGFKGTSSGGSTPALTIQTNVGDGLIKSISNGLVDAVAGADYLTPTGNGSGLTNISFAQLISVPTTLAGYGITDAYTKTQSDTNLAQWQPQLRVSMATTTALPFSPTYSNGTLGVGATLVATSPGVLTIDGQTPTLLNGQNILVKNEAAPAHNGLYQVLVTGTVSVPYQLVRVASFSTAQAINAAGALGIVSGTANALTLWIEGPVVGVVGTDPITFVQYTLNPNSTVVGPGSSVVGDFALWSNTTGNGLSDGGAPGTAAFANLGTSGGTVPQNNGNNNYSGVSTFTGSIVVPGRVITAAGAVTVSATTDYFICVNKTTGAATTINLPATPAAWLTYLIKDCKGDAATNNITITPAAGNIDGSATYIMTVNHASVAVTYDGTQWEVN